MCYFVNNNNIIIKCLKEISFEFVEYYNYNCHIMSFAYYYLSQ